MIAPRRGGPAVALLLASLLVPGLSRADLPAARAALDRGDYAVAETELRGVRGADRAQADLLTGRLYLDTGRYAEARDLGARLARAPASRPEGLTLEGEALALLGQYDDAVARWTSAIERGPAPRVRRARALAARWLARLGRLDDAREAANGLIDEYNDAQEAMEDQPDTPTRRNPRGAVLHDPEFLTYVALAARALGALRDANDAFNEALREAPNRVETNLEQAELMLTTEDMGPAGEAIRTALAANPRSARGLALRARTRLQSDLDFVRATEDLDAAAAVDPRLSAVFSLRAAIVLRDGRIADADALVTRALTENPRDLEALAMRGVVRFFASDSAGFRRAFDALFQVSPTYAEGYDLVADYADWEHRYAEAIDVMREGLARPVIAGERRLQARLRAQLGVNLLRLGREDEGLEELRQSYAASRYNVRVVNLLNFYEETVPREYEADAAGPFRVRYHREEHAVLRRYVPQLLRRAYDDMVRRYRFTPEGPLSIELYSNTEHFSVRTSGLPEIGVQGVCFGRVVTALSPRGGSFNWAQILWHELAHVFAIQRSRSRVPRWFTEGLSEWEAFHSHPEWSREDDPSLYAALAAGRVPRVAEFNTAFTHARRGEDMLVAYYAASRLVEFIIERYGFDRAVSLLPLWGENLATPEVIQRGLGVSADALDTAFRDHLRQRLARYASAFTVDPGDYRERARLQSAADTRTDDAAAQASAAAAALFDDDAERAAQYAERAVRLDARNAVARYVRARLALARRDGRAALEELDGLFSTGRDGYDLRLLEARAARAARDEARLLRALEAASRADPSQVDAHKLLAEVYGRAHRDADRLRELREVVRLDQHDREALGDLIAALVTARAWADLRALHEHATNLDPESVAVHLALAQAAQETGARDAAVYEYESALALEPSNAAAIRERIAAVRRGQRGLPPIAAPPPAGREGSGGTPDGGVAPGQRGPGRTTT